MSIRSKGNRGNIMWFTIHLLAVIFFLPALFVTVPLNIIDSTMQKRERENAQ